MQPVNRFVLPPLPKYLSAFSFLVLLIRVSLFALIVVLTSSLWLTYLNDPRKYPVTAAVITQHDTIVAKAAPYVRPFIPTRFAGKDRLDLILAGFAIVAFLLVGAFRTAIVSRVTARQIKRHLAAWKAQMQIGQDSTAAKEIDKQFSALNDVSGMGRAELLRVFADAKKRLDAWGREVAFLAIDVVGSTEMKTAEDKASVQYDFAEYRKMVESVFKARGAMKSTWTPDGVMAAFADVDNAVDAGKDVIRGLGHFNKQVKLTRTEFKVRCGVNAGYVHFDPAMPLEEMSDRVIDIAGHMQKHAEPNAVAVARKVIEPLRDPEGFVTTEKIVDGYEVSHWSAQKPEVIP